MKRKNIATVVAVGAVLALGLSACGGPSGSGTNTTTNTSGSAGYNAAVSKLYNPSTKQGGTLRMANASDWDSLDPADSYFAYEWNFVRVFGRSLVMFASAPGPDGAKLVPDLAESLGVASDNAKTWTYKLRSGVKFEDGTPVTSKDVKYAVERSLDKEVFPDGPTYFGDYLDLQGYTSAYHDSDPNKLGLKAIETPDDLTIIFHLKQAFGGFDYFAMNPSTIPVPMAKDTGAKYKEHVVSTGPYKFETNNLGKNFTMVRNDQWDPKTDPNRKPMPDRIEVALNQNSDDIDNRLLSGDLDLDIVGSGVGPAAQGRILSDPNLKANSDNPLGARLWYAAINGDVAPLDNIHCRRAVEYAADKAGYQRAYGGETGGEIATNLMPPIIPGAEKFNRYPSGPDNHGDVTKAKDELTQCGQANGFSTSISYRAERPKEKATAESLQQSLAKVGINLTIKPYPASDYGKLYAGKPDFAKSNGLGLMIYGWNADWPDGFGYLSQIVDSRVIRTAGNTNLGVKDPAVDALIDKAVTTTDISAREKIWVDVDKKVMDDAYILPGVWAKGLYYRPKALTNVFITDGFSEYDHLALGVKK